MSAKEGVEPKSITNKLEYCIFIGSVVDITASPCRMEANLVAAPVVSHLTAALPCLFNVSRSPKDANRE